MCWSERFQCIIKPTEGRLIPTAEALPRRRRCSAKTRPETICAAHRFGTRQHNRLSVGRRALSAHLSSRRTRSTASIAAGVQRWAVTSY